MRLLITKSSPLNLKQVPDSRGKNRLGNSGLYVSKVILGGGICGDKRFQPWLLEEVEALPLFEYAWKKGINTWDTVQIPILLFSLAYWLLIT